MKTILYFTKNFILKKKIHFSTENSAKNDMKGQITNSFYLSTPEKMIYSDSSLFTKQYIEKIKQIIGDPAKFKKTTKRERTLITKELDDLYGLETV